MLFACCFVFLPVMGERLVAQLCSSVRFRMIRVSGWISHCSGPLKPVEIIVDHEKPFPSCCFHHPSDLT